MRRGFAAGAKRVSEWSEPLARWAEPHVRELLQNRFVLSFAVHGVVLFVLLNAWWFGAKRMKPAGSSHGVQVMLLASVGAPKASPPAQHHAVAPRRVVATTATSKIAPEPEAEAAPAVEALGDGPATILFIQGFPSQPPQIAGGDLTRDLIVDVQIDETGRVRQTHKERGMGAGVDDVIIATLLQWVFQPAMRSGKAIPSVQELHFHFDARRNPSCGWECVQLMAN